MCDERICLILFTRCLLSISLSFFPNDNGSLSNCQHFLSIDKTPERRCPSSQSEALFHAQSETEAVIEALLWQVLVQCSHQNHRLDNPD